MSQFNLQILTPERKFFEGEVEFIIFDTTAGSVEILANHMRYTAGVVPTIAIIKLGEETKRAVISGGFFEFMENKGVLFAEAAEWPEEIDEERVKKAYERAQERLKSSKDGIDKGRAKMALKRAEIRIKATEKK